MKTLLRYGCRTQISEQVLLPRKLTWNPKMKVWKLSFLSNGVNFRFHVSFRGSIFWVLFVTDGSQKKSQTYGFRLWDEMFLLLPFLGEDLPMFRTDRSFRGRNRQQLQIL